MKIKLVLRKMVIKLKGVDWMLYRSFGKTGKDLSILGFGCMRLPVIGGKQDHIDESKATSMLHYAIDNGVNYVDTAYPYHSAAMHEPGMSEVFVGKALRNGYREKVNLATKLPSWMIKKREDMDYYLDQQLKRLQTDHIDFYLLHGLNKQNWDNYKKLDVFEFLERAIADGRIGYVGFSFHDDLPLFKEIVDAYDWTFCQIQYNYMDEEYQAGREGLEYAAAKGLGVVIMEPLRGGSLVGKIPEDISRIWDKNDIKRSSAEWALRFVWNRPEVGIVLSGMTEMEHVEENIKIAEQGYPDSLNDKEIKLIKEVQNAYKARNKVDCTACKYCMPCPSGVDIPGNFGMLNSAFMYDAVQETKKGYGFFKASKRDASNCEECGQCEDLCPQGISIRKMLKEVEAALT